MEDNTRIIAFYLPQFHPIPENDENWGKGFTEWTNVVSAKPQFRGHNQPRISTDLGFYDLRLPEIREGQVELAKEAGIEGFCYWHYWFGNGKRVLERPFQEVLNSGKPEFPFCLGWANHSWSTSTWLAKNKINGVVRKKLIIEQTYPGVADYIEHFNALIDAFRDSRYIKVDGKPLFLIYNVLDIPDVQLFISTWQKLAIKNGLMGIHFVGNVMGHYMEENKNQIINSGVDATVMCNLFYARKKTAGIIGLYVKSLLSHLGITIEKYNYRKLQNNYLTELEKREDIYPSLYPQLDTTPRRGKQGIVLTGATPSEFKKVLKRAVNFISHKSPQHRIIFINAWNEWGEGAYLEPDLKYGRGFLNAIREVLQNN